MSLLPNEEYIQEVLPIESESPIEPIIIESNSSEPNQIAKERQLETNLSITEEPKVISPKNGLKEFLVGKGFEVVDKRKNGGALWLIGNQDLSPLIEEMKQDNISFTFAYNGSKSTDRRPAWFSTYQD